MKWKCFRRSINYRLENNSSGRIDNYKDPVLISYWNALHADILCAWRRVPTDDGQKLERELWLFGINEDLPSDLINLRRKHIFKKRRISTMNIYYFIFSNNSSTWIME